MESPSCSLRRVLGDASSRLNSEGRPSQTLVAAKDMCHPAQLSLEPPSDAKRKLFDPIGSDEAAAVMDCSPATEQRWELSTTGSDCFRRAKPSGVDVTLTTSVRESSDHLKAALTIWMNYLLGISSAGSESSLSQLRKKVHSSARLQQLSSSDPSVRSVMQRVDQHISSKRLQLKPKVASLMNKTERSRMAKVLSDYSPYWLELGLCAVLDCKTEAGLLELIESFFQATGKTELTKFKEAKRGNVLLQRMLLLILLLDRLAMDNKGLLSPPLFQKSAKCNSSHQILFNLLHGAVAGEGDVMRDLGFLGYKLKYQQSAADVFDWELHDIFADLKDGLRLCRMTDALTGTMIVPTAKFKTEREASRTFNVRQAFKALSKQGFPLQEIPSPGGSMAVSVDDIVHGDPHRTVALLSACVRYFQLPSMLSYADLDMDVVRLRRSLATGRKAPKSESLIPGWLQGDSLAHLLVDWVQAVLLAEGLSPLSDLGPSVSDGRVFCTLVAHYLPDHLPHEDIRRLPSASCSPTPASLPVTAQHSTVGLSVQDVRANFAALQTATDRLGVIPPMVSAEHALGGLDTAAVLMYLGFLCGRLLDASKEERAAQTVQRAWLRCRARQPGAALQCLCRWQAAASLIQVHVRTWQRRTASNKSAQRPDILPSMLARTPWSKAEGMDREVSAQIMAVAESMAAIMISKHWRRFAQQRRFVCSKRAATLIAHRWRAHAATRMAHQANAAAQEAAATAIASAWRGGRSRRELKASQHAAGVIASWWRARLLMKMARLSEAVTTIAKHWRGRMALRERDRMWRDAQGPPGLEQQTATRAVTAIAALWRGHAQRKAMRTLRLAVVNEPRPPIKAKTEVDNSSRVSAAVLIASSGTVRKRLAAVRQSVSIIARWRQSAKAEQQQARCQSMAHAATVISSRWRALVVRRKVRALQEERCQQLELETRASTIIQSVYRGHWERTQAARRLGSVLKIQRAVRRWLKLHRIRQRKAAQASYRQALTELRNTAQLFVCRLQAVTKIQAVWRGHLARQAVAPLRQERQEAAAVLDGWAKAWLTRVRFFRAKRSAVLLQQSWRSTIQLRHRAALTLQRSLRRWMQRQAGAKLSGAVVTIQAAWRGYSIRQASNSRIRRTRQKVRSATVLASSRNAIGMRIKLVLFEAMTHLKTDSSDFPKAVDKLHTFASASRQCCSVIVQGGFLSKVLLALRESLPRGREVSSAKAARPLLALLDVIARRPGDMAGQVAATPRAIDTLAEMLQSLKLLQEPELLLLGSVLFLAVSSTREGLEANTLPARRMIEHTARHLSKKAETDFNRLRSRDGWGSSDAVQLESARRLVAASASLVAIAKSLLWLYRMSGDEESEQLLLHDWAFLQFVQSVMLHPNPVLRTVLAQVNRSTIELLQDGAAGML